jgi:hypothetical protein
LEDFKENRHILGQVINYVDTGDEGKWKQFNMNNIEILNIYFTIVCSVIHLNK